MSEKRKEAFTPGPWQVLPAEDGVPYLRIRGTQLGLRYKVANVIGADYAGALPCEGEETIANAHLIAASPDLYAALEEAVADLEECAEELGAGPLSGLARAINNARAALNRARGEA